MASRRSVDPIATIEAAYETTEDFKSWARGVLETILPELDRGFGVSGCLIRASLPGSTQEVGVGPVPEGMIETMRDMAAGLAMPTHSLLFRPQIATMSEILPSFTAGGPVTSDLEEARDKWNPFGALDAVGMVTQADDETLFMIGAPSARIVRLTPDRKKRLARCAAHIGTALRLRRHALIEQAVVRPDGVVEHAEGRAKERGSLEALRRRAIEIDRARSSLRRRDPEAALSMWKALLDGEWSLSSASSAMAGVTTSRAKTQLTDAVRRRSRNASVRWWSSPVGATRTSSRPTHSASPRRRPQCI
jgi:hypothetical protein